MIRVQVCNMLSPNFIIGLSDLRTFRALIDVATDCIIVRDHDNLQMATVNFTKWVLSHTVTSTIDAVITEVRQRVFARLTVDAPLGCVGVFEPSSDLRHSLPFSVASAVYHTEEMDDVVSIWVLLLADFQDDPVVIPPGYVLSIFQTLSLREEACCIIVDDDTPDADTSVAAITLTDTEDDEITSCNKMETDESEATSYGDHKIVTSKKDLQISIVKTTTLSKGNQEQIFDILS